MYRDAARDDDEPGASELRRRLQLHDRTIVVVDAGTADPAATRCFRHCCMR